ncbi:MAG: hypothetical protein ABIY55_10510 [Kofleriaceae bacterium]
MVLGLTGSAAAQPALMSPSQPPSDPPAGERSEQAALLLSLGAAAASWGAMGLASATHHYTLTGVAAASSLITPSFGHWYAGSSDASWLVLRGAAVATMYVGVLGAFGCDEGCEHRDASLAMLAVGIAGYVASTVGDIATAPAAARRHNRALRPWSLAPMVNRDGGGVAIAGLF